MALFFFMMVFMDTTATIPTGAMAERWAWKNFVLYGLWIALPYCLFANWVWGGGWLAQAGLNWGLGHGAVDFAGSGVVHAMGGVIGLAGAMVLGPAIGKYDKNGSRTRSGPQHPDGRARHVHPRVRLVRVQPGLDALGHRPADQLRRREHDAREHHGAIGAMVALEIKGLKHDPSMLCNGMLAGPRRDHGAVRVRVAVGRRADRRDRGRDRGLRRALLREDRHRRLRRRDLGARHRRPVRRALGWNLRQRGLRRGLERRDPSRDGGQYGADGVRGLLYGDVSQFYAQVLDCGVVAAFGFSMAYAWFKLSNLITPIRVPAEIEVMGLDIPEVGAPGYPDFVITTIGSMHHIPAAMAEPHSQGAMGKVSDPVTTS
jgi:Amt family ammonium transporter